MEGAIDFRLAPNGHKLYTSFGIHRHIFWFRRSPGAPVWDLNWSQPSVIAHYGDRGPKVVIAPAGAAGSSVGAGGSPATVILVAQMGFLKGMALTAPCRGGAFVLRKSGDRHRLFHSTGTPRVCVAPCAVNRFSDVLAFTVSGSRAIRMGISHVRDPRRIPAQSRGPFCLLNEKGGTCVAHVAAIEAGLMG